ncbi:DNA/RNA helicase, superfamily I [Mycobacteroides abscessus subsp. abscessus]|uniref:UvrD-helicase domain-containing protein n=1 Tax=Mycobacteroides abscessus TaxID=36809 RepID=UPI00092B408C|nr:UvrD-helicase domain-containing protein [Mycobacteroides abscessus]SIK10336.1 DNA/RNA helicase, superfamily I [Mycobacteroides abscessus subsp. abscessus]SKF14711.1 DNA/RNA helicase, superfamily I [Mycobacteroides abscessus subsp. abscessus]
MEPTEEQQKIIAAARRVQSLVIQAGAGTGKTATFKKIAADGEPRDSLYITFNRENAVEAKASFPSHVRCVTSHALAHRAVGWRYQARLDNKARQSGRVAAEILGTSWMEFSDEVRISDVQLAQLTLETVARYCHSDAEEITAAHVPRHDDIFVGAGHGALAEVAVRYARHAWKDIEDLEGRLRFVPDYYLKLWALQHPRLDAKVIMLDEAQDTNPVMATLIKNQTHAQQIICGDSNQAMYQWRGAIDALGRWDADEVLYLSKSWRFGQAIAEEANKWLALIGTGLRLSGNSLIDSSITSLPAPDAILCRTNGGAMKQVLEQISVGRKVALVGKTEELKALVRAAEELQTTGQTDHRELYVFNSWKMLQEFVENDAGGRDLKPFVDMVDKHGVAAIRRAVRALVPQDQADTVVSTAHKSKGRQWNTVKVADDFPEENNARPGNSRQADAMIAYVSVTRARTSLDRGSLAWIDRHFPPRPARPVTASLQAGPRAVNSAAAVEKPASAVRCGPTTAAPAPTASAPAPRSAPPTKSPKIVPQPARTQAWPGGPIFPQTLEEIPGFILAFLDKFYLEILLACSIILAVILFAAACGPSR